MKKKVLIIILIMIILAIILVLLFLRFNVYNLKVIEVTDNEIYAQTSDENEYYFFYKDNTIVIDKDGHFIDFSEIQVDDEVKIFVINHYFATSDPLGYSYGEEKKPLTKIEGVKIVKILE